MGDRLTVWEAAGYLRVSRQRVEAIWRNAAYRFPKPASGLPRAWDRAEVEAWAESNWWGTRNWRVRRGVLLALPQHPDEHRQ